MDREKVIKGLEYCAARNGTCQYKQEPICPYVEYCQKEDYAALQRDAITLLKEQEAVIPKYIDGKRNHFIKCGKCNTDLMRGMKYCPHCGQAVKWE